jgi:hypothetical protein
MQSPPESSGYESASDATPHHLVVNMPFPCRKAGARKRQNITKTTRTLRRTHEEIQYENAIYTEIENQDNAQADRSV